MTEDRHPVGALPRALRIVGWVLVVPGLALVVLGARYAAADLAVRSDELDGLGLFAGILLAGAGLLVVVLSVLTAMIAPRRPLAAGVIAAVLRLSAVWAGLHTENQRALAVLLVAAGAALAALGLAVAVRRERRWSGRLR